MCITYLGSCAESFTRHQFFICYISFTIHYPLLVKISSDGELNSVEKKEFPKCSKKQILSSAPPAWKAVILSTTLLMYSLSGVTLWVRLFHIHSKGGRKGHSSQITGLNSQPFLRSLQTCHRQTHRQTDFSFIYDLYSHLLSFQSMYVHSSDGREKTFIRYTEK